jgi:hypothetical protein
LKQELRRKGVRLPINLDSKKIDLRNAYATSGARLALTKMQKIDYAIKQNDSVKAFLIVRKGLENLKADIELLLESAEKSDVKIAIFTNGFSWWFFLPSVEGNIDDKRFWSIDTGNEKPDLAAGKLCDFLSKESFIKDNAVKLAEEICNKRKEAVLINTYLPKAWERSFLNRKISG